MPRSLQPNPIIGRTIPCSHYLCKVAEAQKSDEQLCRVKENICQINKFSKVGLEGNTLVTFNVKIWILQKLISNGISLCGTTTLLSMTMWHIHEYHQYSLWFSRFEKSPGNTHTNLWHMSATKITGKKQYRKFPITPASRDKEPWKVVHINCTGPCGILYMIDVTLKTITFKHVLLTITDACLSWTEFAIMQIKWQIAPPTYFMSIGSDNILNFSELSTIMIANSLDLSLKNVGKLWDWSSSNDSHKSPSTLNYQMTLPYPWWPNPLCNVSKRKFSWTH